jgi:hypothetical protein
VAYAGVDPFALPLHSAWDEFDEGHWICPSVLGGTEKLDAVQKAIDAMV